MFFIFVFFTAAFTFAADSDLDPTFSTGSGLGNQPLALVRQADGKFIVAGNFETVAGARRNKIARLNADGSLDASFTNGSGVDGNGIVWAAAVQNDGKVLIGGEFFSVNGVARSFLARLNADASLDTSFAPQISDRVLAIIVQPDGKILILGDFQSVNGSFQSRKLARLNPDGTQDLSFTNALGNDVGNIVFKLQPDGKILATGGPQRLTRLNANGGFDAFNPGGAGLTGFVNAIELDASNNIYVGGSITAYNGVPRTNLIRVFPDGTLDAAFNPSVPDTTFNQGVTGIGAQADGKIVITGFFSTVNGQGRNGLARVNNDGTIDSGFNPSAPFAGSVGRVLIQPDQQIVVGGQFTTIAGAARARIARLNSNGTIDPTFSRKRGANDGVFNLTRLPDGKVIIGGFFTAVDEQPAGAIARLTPSGQLDTSFNTGSGFVGVVARSVIQPDGKIVVGGFFTSFNGATRMNIARLNADGSLDPSFDSGTSVDAIVTDIAIQTDGKIIIVGLFKTVGGVTGRHVARLNANGTIDSSFNPGTGADFEIDDIELQPNGQMLVAGGFDNFNGTARSSIARLNTNGSLDATFNPSTQFDGAVFSIATQPDGRIVVGGGFNNVNSTARNHVARLNANGSEDTSFQLPGGFTGDEVYKVALQADGKIVVGGTFLSMGGAGRPKVARLNANGTVDASFNTGGITAEPGNEPEVDDIAILRNGKIMLSGEFATLNGIEANRVTRLLGTPIAQSLAPFDFDGDGKTDIGIFRPNALSAEWWINRSSTGQTFALRFGAPTDPIVPADYTGDGKTDIAYFRPFSGEWYVLRSEDFSFFSLPFGVHADIPVPADYDGDGKADFAVFRPSTSTWYISQSSGAPTRIFQFGISGDSPVVSDYDADGKADVGIFRQSAGGAEWWVDRSSAGLLAMQFGANTDKPVQGDYTGDGNADVAIWRPSTGEWLIVRSEDFSFYGFPFGINGDIVAPGDYDGDGKFDVTVFRPSNATWYISRTTAGTQIVQFGANGDRPLPNAFVP